MFSVFTACFYLKRNHYLSSPNSKNGSSSNFSIISTHENITTAILINYVIMLFADNADRLINLDIRTDK